MSSCKPTRFPNGIEVGQCFKLTDGATVDGLAEDIVEVDSSESPYTMNGDEDIILCTGAVTINAISIADAYKSFVVDADGGTVTMNPSGSDTFEVSLITDTNAAKFAPKASTSEWRTV